MEMKMCMYESVTVEQKGTFVRNGERKILGVNGVEIHYIKNTKTVEFDDFKFKDKK
ncbi:hypothetical protein [Bacillus wiedmannii]|uniref:hypothetical protein n=1 Tax=Bacillus wiedmannii TaxID=1890302 RepID=UPI00159BDD0F|nr:hypothetical protein [Bacillus wiedmannii]